MIAPLMYRGGTVSPFARREVSTCCCSLSVWVHEIFMCESCTARCSHSPDLGQGKGPGGGVGSMGLPPAGGGEMIEVGWICLVLVSVSVWWFFGVGVLGYTALLQVVCVYVRVHGGAVGSKKP